jgi:hypothetical protein
MIGSKSNDSAEMPLLALSLNALVLRLSQYWYVDLKKDQDQDLFPSFEPGDGKRSDCGRDHTNH